MIAQIVNAFSLFIQYLLAPLVVGIVLWELGEHSADRRLKADAIRDLMAYRGDYGSADFRRALNKVSITFHNDEEIRLEVRHLYEVINSPSSTSKTLERSIVGLIYKLCQRNKFKGLTEYDIDQSFPENKQAPQENAGAGNPVAEKQEENSPAPRKRNVKKK